MFFYGTAGIVLVHALPTVAYLANFTIDDTLAQYVAQERLWDARSFKDGCAECLPQPGPDADDALGRTWHAKTTFPGEAPSNITFSFYGSAVYVFFILANNVSFPDANTYLAFHLDGANTPSGIFHHLHDPAVGWGEFLYNQLVFSRGALQVGQHSMAIRCAAQGRNASLALFDYALYSDEVQEAPSSSHVLVPASTITVPASPGSHRDVLLSVGAAVGAAALMACISAAALAFWIVRRRKHRAARTNTAGPSPRTDSGDASPDAHLAPSRSRKAARLGLVSEKSARGGERRAASRRAGSDRPPHYAP